MKFNSKQLNDYIMFKLDKLEDEYTIEELNQIEELVIEDTLDINSLIFFNNLKNLEFRNIEIEHDTIDILLKLDNLKDIKFQLCTFKTIDNLNILKVKGFHLDCCKITDYSFIYEMLELNELTLTGLDNLNISKINKLTKLRYLNISHSKCINEPINIYNLEELYIDNSSIKDIFFTKELPNLKVLSLSKEQYEDKNDLINELKQKNIEILDYGIMLLGDF